MEFSRDKCKIFKQNESPAQIIFRKALGVYIGSPTEEKVILSYNRTDVDIVILPSSH